MADVVVLHLLVGLVGETAAYGAPLVVGLLHVLPVDPCLGLYVAHIIKQFLSQAQVAADAAAARSHFAHPVGLACLVGQLAEACAVNVVAGVGVGVPLAHQLVDACRDVALHALYGQSDVGLVGCRDDGVQSRLGQDGSQHADELDLRLIVEVASLLWPVGKPEVGNRLVEGLQGLEFDAVFLFIMFAHVHQVVGELLVVFGAQVVLAAVGIAAAATAVGHVPGARVAEGLEDGIGTFLLDFEHYLALGGIAVPVIDVVGGVLESLHLGPQSLASAHVVEVAVAVLGVVAATDVVAEVTVVEPRGADQPGDNLVNLLIRPLAALGCPPAERYAPAVEVLAHDQGVDHVAQRVGRRSFVDAVAQVPLVLDVRTVLVREDLGVGIVAVGAQILAVRLAAQFHELAGGLFDGELGLVERGIADEGGVPRAGNGQELVAIGGLYVVVALPVGYDGHLLRVALRGRLYPSASVGASLQMVAAAVHHEHLGRL